MKAISITKRFASILALLLAIMMLFAACGPDENVSDTSSEIDDSQTSSVESEETPDDETPSDTTPNNSSSNPSKNDGGNQKPNNTQTNNTPTNGKLDGFNNSKEATIYKNAPKGEVNVLMWRRFLPAEQQVVNQYQRLTGNKIKATTVSYGQYQTKLVSMISGGNSPDVVMFQSAWFPGMVTKALQPLPEEYFQLDSDCWNKSFMDEYRINGVYFGVAQPKSWSCEDCNYVTYYFPKILKSSGITTTPYQLYKEGKWNWETQSEIARKTSAKGHGGIMLQSSDMMMLSAGADFVEYNGSQFTNLLGKVKGNNILTKAWMEVAKLNQDNALIKWNEGLITTSKYGLMTAISFGLTVDSGWPPASLANQMEVVPVAGPKGGAAYTPVQPKVWGVPKKAKNVEGAAYFLRYFLDTSVFDFDKTFKSSQFKEVNNIITNPKTKKKVAHGSGVSDYVVKDNYKKICDALQVSSPDNITTTLNSKKNAVETGISRANKDLLRIKKK